MIEALNVLQQLYELIKALKPTRDDMVVIYNRHIIILSDNTKLSYMDVGYDTGVVFTAAYYEIDQYMKTGNRAFLDHTVDYYHVIDIFNRYSQYDNVENPVYFEPDAKGAIPDLFNLRATDGYRLAFLGNTHIMPVFSGIMKAAKKDKVCMYVFQSSVPEELIIRFNAHIAKCNKDIVVYTRHFRLL